jgi:hypothetical protein
MNIFVVPVFFRHHPPPGLAFGEPDDRLQRVIQYAVTSAVSHNRRGVLDARLRGHDSGG